MANITDGNYIIYNAANTALAIDVSASSFKNGANIQLWNVLNNDAQIWTVSTRDDGTLQIASRLCGKCLDVKNGSLVAGQNVQLFNDNDTAAQCFVAEEAGTSTIGGKSYTNYYIKVSSNPSLRVAASSAAAGGNIALAASSTANTARWAFVPVPMFVDGGLYEIRSLLDTSMALDVLGANTANGANIQIYPANGTNAQKFVITEEETGYSIRNIASAKYVDVLCGQARSGQNVQTFEDNDTRAQRWSITEYSTKTVNGVACLVVKIGSYVDGTGSAYYLDVLGADKHAYTNVQIYASNLTDAQKWVLVPTTATDPAMPAPYSLGITDDLDAEGSDFATEDAAAYATWKCAPAWCADGANHYEMRFRRRLMSPTVSTWNDWGEWTGWDTQVVKTDKQRIWSPVDIRSAYSWTDAKNEQVEVQVRAAGSKNLSLLHGNYTDAVFNIYKKPTVSITQAVWSPAGMKFVFGSDYDAGMTYLSFSNIDGKLASDIVIGDDGVDKSVVVDRSKLRKWYSAGDAVKVKYRVGYDQRQTIPGTDASKTLTVATAGGTIDLSPEFVEDGSRLIVVFTNAGTSRAWTKFDNDFLELDVAEEYNAGSGKVAYEVIYPTDGEEFSVFMESKNADETVWGAAEETYQMSKICHAWTIDGASYYVRTFVGSMPTYTYSHSAVYAANILDGREHEAVSFNGTVKGSFTAEGVLLHGEETTARDIENLVGKHCVFRDIHGGVRRVAVVDATITRHETYDEVSVAMIEETL